MNMQKLNTLTSLRFIAAAMIVIYHLNGDCGTHKWETMWSPLMQAVSFFFILSGFILTYSYPSLENWQTRKKFLVARIARIWPSHFVLFFIFYFLALLGIMGNLSGKKVTFLNMLMVHAWVPFSQSYFSFNSPSWSISTEFFFYLCFPFIIFKWSKTYVWKTVTIFAIPLILILLCAYFQIPHYSSTYQGITNHGLLYINPLARMPEFLLGILAAHLWIKYKHYLPCGTVKGSLIECLVILMVFINLYYYDKISESVIKLIPLSIAAEFQIWIATGILTSLSFMLMIMILAQSNGIISKILSMRMSVLFGEISFAMYLLHIFIYQIYVSNFHLFGTFSNKTRFTAYWLVLLSCSYLFWRFIEHPLRNLIVSTFTQQQVTKRNALIATDQTANS